MFVFLLSFFFCLSYLVYMIGIDEIRFNLIYNILTYDTKIYNVSCR